MQHYIYIAVFMILSSPHGNSLALYDPFGKSTFRAMTYLSMLGNTGLHPGLDSYSRCLGTGRDRTPVYHPGIIEREMVKCY